MIPPVQEPSERGGGDVVGTGRFLAAALLALVSMTVEAATQPRVQYAEKVALSTSAGRAEFDAFGRRFALSLEPNDRALAKLRTTHAESLAGYRLWRGALEGQPDSWTRLAEIGGRLEGVIWDGRDLYVVGSYAEVANYLSAPMLARPGDTVVFRLSDTLDFLPQGYCATAPTPEGLAANNGLVQYRNLVAELQVVAPGPTQQIQIAMIADSHLQTMLGDAMARMVASYNIVDGIYAEQLKLLILPEVMQLVPASDDPFTATEGSGLLAQLSTYRQARVELSSLGITHLFTGADLDGDPIGIARIRGACTTADGVSLTEGWYGSSTTTALIMAHELGHNLGAEHDGTGSCSATPETFIMAPNLNGSSTFSQCSVNVIKGFIASASPSCVTTPNYAHVELPQVTTTLEGEVDSPIVVPYDIASTGTRAADGVALDLRLNSNLVLTAMPAGVACTPTTLGIRCTIGAISAGSTKHLEFTFLPSAQGNYEVTATVSATNNQNTRNSTQRHYLNIAPSVDASVEVTTSAQTAMFGDMVDITITVRSIKSHTARDVRVGQYGGGLAALSADVPAGASCQFNATNPGQTFCTLGDIPGGQARHIILHARASQVGTSLQGTVYLVSSNDSDSSNNNAYFTMRVNAVHDVGLEDAMPSVPLAYNMPYEFKANLRSLGSQPVDSVRVDLNMSMQVPSALDSITSVTIGGNNCTRLANWHYDCVVGTMAAGEVLTLSVKGVATGLGQMSFLMNSYASVQDVTSNDTLYDAVIVKYGLDAAVSHSYPQISGVEGVEISGYLAAWSYGVQPTSNAVATIELPPQAHFTRYSVTTVSTTTCSIVDPQHLRCVYNVPPSDTYQNIIYYAVGDAAGTYQARATIVLPGDENPANDTTQWSIVIDPVVDLGMREFTLPGYLIAGHPQTVPVNFITGSRAVPGANATISTNTSALLDSVATSAGTCNRLNPWQFQCLFGDLPANGGVDVSAVMSASSLMGSGTFTVVAGAPGDNVPQNNTRSKSFQVVAESDVSVRVDLASVTGTSGSTITLPSIIVSRSGGNPVEPKLRFSLPVGVEISGMSGALLICSGNRDIECQMPGSIPAGSVTQVDLKVTANSAMTFTVPVSVSAANDLQPSNDSTSFTVTVNAPAAPPPPSGGASSSGGGGGGGGGRIEWSIAVLLGMLLIRRQRRLAFLSGPSGL
jgi:hypothetical protein